MRFRFFFIILTTTLALPVFARANLLSFRPRITSQYGILGLEGMLSRIDKNLDGEDFKQTRTNLKESINLGAFGFSYHPYFIQYVMKGSLGLSQSKGSSKWYNRTSEEYDFTAKVLPRHRYNLELFTKQERPLLLGVFGEQSSYIIKDSGATLNYIQRKWDGSTNYLLQERKGSNLSITESWTSSLSFSEKYLSLNGSYRHTDNEIRDTITNKEDVRVRGALNFRKVRLSSQFTQKNDTKQKTGFFVNESQTTTWRDALKLELPWNFDTNLNYTEYKNANNEHNPIHGTDGYSLYLNTQQSLDVSHTIYNSVVSRFFYTINDSESPSGQVHVLSKLFTATYRKKILGNNFSGTYKTQRTHQVNNGSLLLIDEKHTATLADLYTFTLNSTQIDESTITITATGIILGVTETGDVTDFHITKNGNFVEITIDPLTNPLLTGTREDYEYMVNYNLLEADYTLDRRKDGYILQAGLFNTLTLFHSHDESAPTSREGSLPTGFTAEEQTSDAYGVGFRKKSFRLSGQYSKKRSLTDLQDSWSVKGSYDKKISPESRFITSLQHKNKDYSTRLKPGSDQFSFIHQKSTGATISLRRNIPHKKFTSQYDTGYNKDQTDSRSSNNFFFTSNLTWRIGKTKITLYIKYDRIGTSDKTDKSKTEKSSTKLSITRKLF